MLSILFWLFIIGGIIGAAVKLLQVVSDWRSQKKWDREFHDLKKRIGESPKA